MIRTSRPPGPPCSNSSHPPPPPSFAHRAEMPGNACRILNAVQKSKFHKPQKSGQKRPGHRGLHPGEPIRINSYGQGLQITVYSMCRFGSEAKHLTHLSWFCIVLRSHSFNKYILSGRVCGKIKNQTPCMVNKCVKIKNEIARLREFRTRLLGHQEPLLRIGN